MRLALATLLSPLALLPAMAVYMLAIVLGSGATDGAGAAAGLGGGLLLGGFGLFFGLLASMVVLLPGALLLRRAGMAGVRSMTLLGLVGGAILALVEPGALAFLFYGLAGTGMGLAFGLLAGPALKRDAGPVAGEP